MTIDGSTRQFQVVGIVIMAGCCIVVSMTLGSVCRIVVMRCTREPSVSMGQGRIIIVVVMSDPGVCTVMVMVDGRIVIVMVMVDTCIL